MSESNRRTLADVEILSKDEIMKLVLATVGDRRADEAEMMRVIKWAEGVRLDNALLSGLLTGQMHIQIKEGEEEPTFSLPRSAS